MGGMGGTRKTKAYSESRGSIEGAGSVSRLKTEAFYDDRNGLRASQTTTIEGEVLFAPVDVRIVALKPVESENDGITDGNDGEGDVFGVRGDAKVGDDILGDQPRGDGALIYGHDGDRYVFESTRK